MYLTERTSIRSSALPLADLRAYLRIGTGFGDASLQDDVLEIVLRAAIDEIERYTATSLLYREFVLNTRDWSRSDCQWLPRAPVAEVIEIGIQRPNGVSDILDPSRYRLIADDHRSAVHASGYVLPSIPVGGDAKIVFGAGFGTEWGDVPSDLALAVLSLAAARYEDRGGVEAMPNGVRALVAAYRPLRILRTL